MNGVVAGILRALLGALFVGTVVVQACAGWIASTLHGGGPTALVTVILVVAGGLCVEGVLVSVWMLASRAGDETIFDSRSNADRWTSVAIGSLSLGALFAVAGSVCYFVSHAYSGEATELVLAVSAIAVAAISAALALVVVVMRRLLRTAVGYQSDLSEVI